MAGIPWQSTLQHKLGQQLLVPVDDAMGLARRYRELDAFRDYVAARLRLVVPACALIGVTAIACGLAPVMALVGTQAFAALLGLLLAPVALVGSLFVLLLVFFSWLEERSLARSLGHRTSREHKAARWIRKKLRADLGRLPRVPWLLATLFVGLPFVVLLRMTPLIGIPLLVVLAAAPIAFARLDR
ncbi:MAG: hypothetical protein OEV81_09085 [Betaproteobacteria bacterium]|nr:hypothetical protein [Betaproteobacteria bacterium]MDH5222783.1 hypothetical protein [Betaproteobacteria bacterium]MDH5349662.1 hypothetical protein [Betaproteobacteria bacterium]